MICSSAQAATVHSDLYSKTERKYLNPQSVKITSEGMFVVVEGKKIPLRQLLADEHGKVYIEKKVDYYECPNGCGWFCGFSCPKCGWPEKKQAQKEKKKEKK